MKRQFLEVGDLPKDGQSSLHKLRPTLVRAFNTARTSPVKMKLLKDTMKFMYNSCVAFEKLREQSQAKASKASQTAGKYPESTKSTNKDAK